MKAPFCYPELNAVLQELVESLPVVLEDNFLAAYLQGSFALGDYDRHSDVDFVIAINREVSDVEFSGLQELHARLYDLDTPWAKHLEGSYFPRTVLQKQDPSKTLLLYLDNTSRELEQSDHDNTLVVRWVTREYGITLAGPDAHQLVDPVLPDDLRQEVCVTMQNWAAQILSDSAQMNNRWYQPYAVLSYCRMLQTLETGRVFSKLAGANWAVTTLDSRWSGLIQRAWEDRPDPSAKVRQKADPEDFAHTLDFIRYALAVSLESGICAKTQAEQAVRFVIPSR